jgi:hypothetical protein
MAKTKKDPTILELEEKLKDLKRKEKQEKLARKKEYEALRNEVAEGLVTQAKHLSAQILEFKEQSLRKANEFRNTMLEYGELRGGADNKGSFEFKDASDTFKVVVKTNTIKGFDERADMAEQHLKTFLESFVKKRDKLTYNMIIKLLERNVKTGKLDISNINRLYTMEEEISNEEFTKAITLFKESYQDKRTATYIQFYHRSEASGQWLPVVLNITGNQ